ncbi:MAG: 16S rRNA G1207 methylase RsmC [Planctomycetaceae bacterium]
MPGQQSASVRSGRSEFTLAGKSKKKSHREKKAALRADADDKFPGWKKPLRPIEQSLFDVADEIRGDRIVVVSNAGAQAAAEIARQNPNATVICNFLDAFLADSARARNEGAENLEITCLPDLPEGSCDAAVIPFPAKGESDLAREYLQQVVQLLSPGGKLFASSDNVNDRWLHEQLRAAFQKVTNRETPKGRLYIASKPKPLKKIKDFGCWFAFRDGERLINACSRPAVFSHRRMDNGARALIDSLTIEDGPRAGQAVKDNFRVLDIGCGNGSVGFAAAFRAENVQVCAMDANARAVQSAALGAEKNGITGFTTQLEAAGQCAEPGTFDLALANPPYFSNFRIAEIFVQAAINSLKPGGRLHFVTKQPEWFADRFVEVFDEVSVLEARGYFVVKATQLTPQSESVWGSSPSKSSTSDAPVNGGDEEA